ncbi:MAG: helix-turn-helix domain-containing protein [Bacteroidales bacterium]|jgi:AcrR family transcriptional regulator|nr:helix-turn-helix domain-containing protein [Bacteroidales bacterium]
MTEKQEKILHAALELFAREGFKTTSTSKVAKHAGVSEGLIFRHFGSKDGLLEAILKEGEERIKVIFSDIIFESDAQALVLKTLDAFNPRNMRDEELEFWKLQYKIKWELEQYGEHKMEPLRLALTNAFEKLGYRNPGQEAIRMLIELDGMATRYFLMENFDYESLITFLKEKYTK